MVFWHLCKSDCKEVNWAEQLAMERPNIYISHKFKEFHYPTFLKKVLVERTWNLIFSGINTNVQP